MPATPCRRAWSRQPRRGGYIVAVRISACIALRPGRGLLFLGTSDPTAPMPDSDKATTAVIRALLDEMAKALAKPKPQPIAEGDEFIPPPRRRTRVNVREFLKGQKDQEEESWWDSGSDGDPLIGLRPPRRRRGPRPRR